MSMGSLTPDSQEKARECETAEDLTALAASEGIELSDENLDGIVGGVSLGSAVFAFANIDDCWEGPED